MRRFDHIDLRVRSLAEVRGFYARLLPALGFEREATIEGWMQFESGPRETPAEFFGITESPGHQANENRVAFWAESPAEVDRIARSAQEAGARRIEGPVWETPQYYACFFEDPCGNRLEICHRTAGAGQT